MSVAGVVESLLRLPTAYSAFQRVVGAERLRRRYVAEHLHPRPGDEILDVGCGPADILSLLPEDVRYHGLDLSADYIDAARRRFGDRGAFEVKDVSGLAVERPGRFDLVMANGLLHHLDDGQALHLFRTAAELLKPGGRWVSYDGCYAPGQSGIARLLLGRDRGRFVRDEPGYLRLIREVFPSARAVVRHDLLTIPYTHIILEAAAPERGAPP